MSRLVLEFVGSNAAQLLAPLFTSAGVIALLTRVVRFFREQRRRAWSIGFPMMTVGGLALWNLAGPTAFAHLDHPDASRLIRAGKWISYAPDRAGGDDIDLEVVRRELEAVRGAGFTGIVMYSMSGERAGVPVVASELGLDVIAGVWDPTNRDEVANAIAAERYVDGYCVGHIGLHDGRYRFRDLVAAMHFIRFRTARPVTTTEKLTRYETDPRILSIGDWIFPDAHLGGIIDPESGRMAFSADAERDAKLMLEYARLLMNWDSRDRRGREILLKTVGYPHRGVPGASEVVQRRFFVLVLSQLPTRVSACVHTAYDVYWKIGWPYYPWDLHMSLFDEQRRPRPAVSVIVERL